MDQIDIVTFVVNRVIAKAALYVCVLSLIIAAISMLISLISLFKQAIDAGCKLWLSG